MNPRKRSTQTKILNALAGVGLALTSTVQAQDDYDYSEKMVIFSDPTGQTDYEFKTSHLDFNEPFEQFAEGACGVLTNITTRPVYFDLIQTLEENYGTLSRGAGQVVQNATEVCLKLMLPKDVTDHVRKIGEEQEETMTIGLTVTGVILGACAAILAAIVFMVWVRHLYLRAFASRQVINQALPPDDQTSLLGDIEQPATPAEPSEPARTINTVVERWEAIEKAARAQGKQVILPKSFICPITCEIMENPVCDAGGHSYHDSAITNWFMSSNKSPATGESMQNKTLINNYALKGAIEEFLQTCEKDLGLTCYKEPAQTVDVDGSEKHDEILEPEKTSSFKMQGSF